ncbi:hypothetical protein GCM10009792_07240 [Microcella alkalica]
MRVALALPGPISDVVELELLRAGHRIAWRAEDRESLLTQLAECVPDVVLVADDPAVATTEVVGACDLLGVRTCLVRADEAVSATARLLGVHDILRVLPEAPIDLRVLAPPFDALDGGIADAAGVPPGLAAAPSSSPPVGPDPHSATAPGRAPAPETPSDPGGGALPPHRIDPAASPIDADVGRRRTPREPGASRRWPWVRPPRSEPAPVERVVARHDGVLDGRQDIERPDRTTGVAAAPPQRVVAIWGPAGAPGRTTLAISLAAELAARGHRVCLVDADTYGGTVAPALGLLDEAPGFAAACRLAGSDSLTEAELDRIALTYGGTAAPFRVLTGIGRPHRWPELSRDRVARALEAARRWNDVVVVDTGFNLETDEEVSSDMLAPRRNAATIAALRAADEVVAVGAADPVGLARLLRTHADLLETVTTDRVHVVANRVRGSVLGIDPAGQVRQTLDRFGGIVDPILVADDPSAADAALLSARTVLDVAPRSALRQGAAALTDRLGFGAATARSRSGAATRGRGMLRRTG